MQPSLTKLASTEASNNQNTDHQCHLLLLKLLRYIKSRGKGAHTCRQTKTLPFIVLRPDYFGRNS